MSLSIPQQIPTHVFSHLDKQSSQTDNGAVANSKEQNHCWAKFDARWNITPRSIGVDFLPNLVGSMATFPSSPPVPFPPIPSLTLIPIPFNGVPGVSPQ